MLYEIDYGAIFIATVSERKLLINYCSVRTTIKTNRIDYNYVSYLGYSGIEVQNK